jgi:CheY-like chemotaxis protein
MYFLFHLEAYLRKCKELLCFNRARKTGGHAMRILVAEDEESIATVYQIALRSNGHQVVVTSNGLQCVQEYKAKCASCSNSELPFDVLILDYRMPVMDGFEAAKNIIKIRPDQRIIFASAYARETLTELIKNVGIVAELLQKPFEIDVLIDTVEDTSIYHKLQELQVKIGDVKSWNPTHKQLSDLLEGILKLSSLNPLVGKPVLSEREDKDLPAIDSKNKEDDLVTRIIDEALSFLGPESLSVFYYHLANLGVQKTAIVHSPREFLKALDILLGSASGMIQVQILKTMEANNDLTGKSDSMSKFMNSLKPATENMLPVMGDRK